MLKLDTLDFKLLEALQSNSKQTHKALAMHLGLSITAVHARIKKLERARVITAYGAYIDGQLVGKGFRAFCHVKLLQHNRERLTQFEKQVIKFPEVLACFHVSGAYDYLLHVVVKDMAQYRTFMVQKLTTLPGIGSTESSFTIATLKNTHQIPLLHD